MGKQLKFLKLELEPDLNQPDCLDSVLFHLLSNAVGRWSPLHGLLRECDFTTILKTIHLVELGQVKDSTCGTGLRAGRSKGVISLLRSFKVLWFTSFLIAFNVSFMFPITSSRLVDGCGERSYILLYLINQSNLDSGHSEIADRSATLSLIIVDIAFVKSNLGEASNTFASVKLDQRKVLITFKKFATVCKLCHSAVQCQGRRR